MLTTHLQYRCLSFCIPNSDFHFVHELRMFYKVVIHCYFIYFGLIKCIISNSNNYSVKCMQRHKIINPYCCACIPFRHLKSIFLSRDSLFLFQPVSRCKQNYVWNIYVSCKFYISWRTLDIICIISNSNTYSVKCMQLGKLFAIFLENLVIVKSPSYANYQTEPYFWL
jgi:hypothetical protein